MIEFLQNNYEWIVALLTALLSIIVAFLKLFTQGLDINFIGLNSIGFLKLNGDYTPKQKE